MLSGKMGLVKAFAIAVQAKRGKGRAFFKMSREVSVGFSFSGECLFQGAAAALPLRKSAVKRPVAYWGL